LLQADAHGFAQAHALGAQLAFTQVLFDLHDLRRAELAIAKRLEQRHELTTAGDHDDTAFFMR
jgi:hypothetical protein